MTAAKTPRRRRGDSGAAAIVVVLLTPVLFAVAGFVLDGGRAIAARQSAADLAEQAARAGADQLDVTTLRATGTDVIDGAAAQAAACRYVHVAAPTAGCTVTVTGEQVAVTVRTRTPTVLLGIVGINSFHTGGWASARAVTGVETADGTP